MSNLPIGKTMYTWILSECAGGDMERLADKAVEAGFRGLFIKATNGTEAFVGSRYLPIQQELIAQLVPLLVDRGIDIHFWGYFYGRTWRRVPNGKLEAEAALNMLMKYKGLIKSFSINAEHQFKERNSQVHARILADALRDGIDDLSWDVLLGLSSYRYPSYHPKFPFSTFAPYIDYWNPQIYWMGDRRLRAGEFQLKKSINEMEAIRKIPIIPIGFAFAEHGYAPTVDQIDLFDQWVRSLGLKGVSYWSWQHAEKNSDWWESISAHDWPGPVVPTDEPGSDVTDSVTGFPLPEINDGDEIVALVKENRDAINFLSDKI